jgi:hypothetical protein
VGQLKKGRQVFIVVIEERDVPSTRGLDAHVSGVRNSQAGCIPQDPNASVARETVAARFYRAIIDDNELEVWQRLGKDAGNRSRQHRCTVARR